MENKNIQMAQKIAYEVSKMSGRAYYVGGYVRDLIRHVDNKDIDIEVHGIHPEVLEEILDNLGSRMQFGESFGIYALKGYTLDIAIPRKEHQKGKGHKNFDVLTDPFIGTLNASKRRDFTVNSIMQDILTGEIIDHFNGVEDIHNKVIRHVNTKTFCEDSLRVLRAAQFGARFNFTVCEETKDLLRQVSLADLSKERVYEELKKALLTADKPSVFFEILKEIDKLDEWFFELKNLIGVKQNPKYHPEGDVWTHTMITLDSAAKYRNKVNNPLSFMLLALCHDMGKAVCTKETDGVIHSYRHETEGLALAEDFIKRLTCEKAVLKYVLNMTKNHMRPYVLAMDKSSLKATNKMFDQVFDPVDAICFSLSDNSLKEANSDFEEIKEFLFDRLKIFKDTMGEPYVTGKDLLDAGLKQGKAFKDALSYSHKLRLAGVKKEIALKETLSYFKRAKSDTNEDILC